jgi:hypothetical protein
MFISLVRLIRNYAALGKPPNRKNQRVKLISQNYKSTAENPIMGTKYECEGTVIHVSVAGSVFGEVKISVKWDNEFHNIYTLEELEVSDLPCSPRPYRFNANFTKNNPNYTFKKRKASLKYHETTSDLKEEKHLLNLKEMIATGSRKSGTWT